MRIHIRYLVLIMLFVIINFAGGCGHHSSSIESEHSKKEVKVEVTKPQLNQYTEPFTLSGAIKARQKAVLSSRVPGHIIDMPVGEGSRFKAGQVLARIDDSETKLSIANSRTDEFKIKAEQEELNGELEELQNRIQMLFHDQEKYLSESELAQTTYDRISKLFDKDVATQQELDEAKTTLDGANSLVARSQAEYNMLVAQKKKLDARNKQLIADMEKNSVSIADAMVKDMYTQIVAPMDGVVVKKHSSVGDVVMPGNPILTVENTDDLFLEINVEESQAYNFQPGTQLEVFIDAYNKAVPGKIRVVVPASDPDSHTMKVKIDIPAHELIYSGMYARVVIPMKGENYFIPRTAIVQKGQVTGVFVVDKDNIARFRIIKTGQDIQGFIEIISGLTDADKVIISNLEEVTDGTKVVILGEK